MGAPCMRRTIIMKIETILKKAKNEFKRLNSFVGQPVPKSDGEKVRLAIDYFRDEAIYNEKEGYWDIPQYTNGTTRPARCIFLLHLLVCGDGEHCCVGSWEEINRHLAKSEREKILASGEVDGNLVEYIWSYDMAGPLREGQWWYHIDHFWIGLRINGQIISRSRTDTKNYIEIKNPFKFLNVPNFEQKCYACEKTKNINKMELVKSNGSLKWLCKGPKELYSKCPE